MFMKGHASLPDVNGNEIDLYLTTNGKMPAPRIFWKILYDPETTRGIAFISLNNPYQRPETIAQDVRCRDICDNVIRSFKKVVLNAIVSI